MNNGLDELPNFLPGIPPVYGLKQQAPSFNQGDDILIEFDLLYNNQSIDPNQWVLEAFVKKSLKATIVLCKGDFKIDLFKKVNNVDSNTYCFRIPAESSSLFVPGAYFYSIKGKQKVGEGEQFSITTTLQEGMFDIDLSAHSPNPRLTAGLSSTWIFDPINATFTLTVTGSEPTEPLPSETITV